MSSLSTSLYGSTTNKGVGGLLSGLDTDDLVKQMTAATRNKINRQFQSKQKLLYRQEAYREISTKLLSFSDKYFSYSSGSKTNILSPSFFKSYTFDSSSNYVNVSGNADNIKNFSINSISSVATAASFTSSKKVTSGAVDSDEITDYVSSLAGETLSLEYDGKTYNLTLDKDFGKNLISAGAERPLWYADVVNELNEQIDKISDLNGGTENNVNDNKIKYSISADGKLELSYVDEKKAKLAAASTDITNILKMKVGQEATSTESIVKANLTLAAQDVFSNAEAYITFDYNGVVKKINLKEGLINPSDVATHMQTELNKAYGLNADGTNKVKFEYINDKFKISAAGDTNIFGVSSISKDLGNLTGIESDDYNRLSKTKSLKDLGINGLVEQDTYQININGEAIDIKNTMTVTEIINTINSNAKAGVKVSYSSTTNTFSVKATETGIHKGITIVDMNGGNLAKSLFGSSDIDYVVNEGTDTVMTYTLNGVSNTITRSTANFTIDEINVELNEKAVGLTSTDAPITFDVTNNSDEVVERVKKFVEEYNEIINLISTKTSEKPNRSYLPITPEQQDEMEEDEIKNWNIEAKKGVLFGDRNMTSVLRKMRESMSGLTDVSTVTLSSIGISSASMDTSGKLILDEKKFKEKLLENPEEIANLFTAVSSSTASDAKSGIALQLQSLLRENVGTYGTTGILIDEAGLSNSMTSDKNYISEKIEEYDDKMEELKKDLEVERQRYWKQFSALESSLNKLNAQSSWLTDSMGQ